MCSSDVVLLLLVLLLLPFFAVGASALPLHLIPYPLLAPKAFEIICGLLLLVARRHRG